MSILLYPSKTRSLARLATLTSDKWMQITTTQLPKTLKGQLNQFYVALTGAEMAEDLTTLLVAFDKDTHNYVRTYAPSIYSNEQGQPILVWGNEPIILTPELLEILDVEIELVELEKYKETCLVLYVNDGELLELPLQLRLNNDNREMKLKSIKNIIKDIKAGKADMSTLGDILYIRVPKEVKEFVPTLSIKELEPTVEYFILEAEYKDFGTHDNFILKVRAADSDEELFCYSPGKVRDALKAGAVLSDEANFVVFQKVNKKGNMTYDVSVFGLEWDLDDSEMLQF